MESDAPAISGPRTVLKTVNRMPRTFINQLYAIDVSVMAWVSLGSISYALCAFYFMRQSDDESCTASLGEQVASVAWTFQVQTAAFGAVLLLNLMNLGMRQHLLPFKCNLLLLYINGVAFVTDLLLWRGATTVLLSSSGRPFAPLRYVQWCHSTPTMIYMLALLADCSGWQLSVPLLSDVVMVVTGLLACYTAGPLKFVATVLSFVTFGVVLYYVYGMFHKTLTGDVSPEQRSTLLTVLALLLALWSAFPVVWLAADWQLMGPEAEAVAWGVCDYLAKVVFSSQLWQSNLTEVQLRRDRALEAWEASNRVEAVARLTALLKQRDDLLSTLSHELRTPLAGIVALSESLCQEVSAALPRSAQNLATVRATATCMLNIVTSTLDSFAARRCCEPGAGPGVGGLSLTYQPPDADAGPVAPSVPLNPLELRPLVETVMNVLRPLAHDGVAIVSDLPANLPQVAADVTRLSQVLYNLVGNAMRFTAHGEVRIAARVVLPEASDAVSATPPAAAVASAPSTLLCADGAGGDFANGHATAAATSLSSSGGGGGGIWRYARPRLSMSSVSSCSSAIITYPPGTQVEVSVEDTGVGIAQELLDELFLPYRTGHAAAAQGGGGGGDGSSGESSQLGGAGGRASKSIGGTGLGLYLVRLALRAQGSDITAESAPGIGSVFRFRLPATQPPPRRSHDHQSSRQATRQRRGGSLDERRRADNELLGAQAPLSGGSACECESGDVHSSSTTSGAAAGSEGSGADRDRALAAAPSSPKPVAALSSPKPAMPASPPRPWIASATARLVKLSGGRVGGSSGGAAVGGPAAAAACGPVPPRALTGALPQQEPSSPLNGGRPLRMSLDEATHNKQMRQPPLPPAAGSRCRPSCAAGCCAPELSPVAPSAAAVGAAETTTGSGLAAEAAVLAPSASVDAVATVSGGNGGAAGAAPLALVSTTPARVVAPALTPTPNPTAAAAARVAVPAAMSMTAFDAAHAIEEGRALLRTGLRPNFRHRNGGTLQVLSVDDDPINQLVAGQMLTSQAWKVVKCMNGPEALVHLQLIPRPNGGTAAAAAASPTAAASLAAAAAAAQALLLPAVLPDCVLLDVMMPGMSGFEVCRKLRQHFTSAQLPIIIVSAKGDTAAVDEAFESGADDYMTKPYKRTEMVARIKAQIRTRDSLTEAAAAQAQAAAAPPPAGAASESGVAVAAAPAPLPPPTTTSCGATTASSTPRACSSAVASRALLGCGGAGSDLAPPSPSRPTTLPPQHPLSQDNLPTSVDLLLVQQTTPDFIKTRMEASRGGLDGSWGKVGLYKRDNNMLTRTGAATEAAAAATSPWDAAARAGAAKEQAMVPAAVLASPCALAQPGGDAPAGTVAPETAAPHSADSGVIPQRPDGPTAAAVPRPAMADAAVGMSKPLPTLPEDTVIGPKAELGGTAAASVGTGSPTPLLSGGSAAAAAAATTMAASSTDAGRVTDASTVPAAADGGNAAGGDGGAGGEPSAATALICEMLTEVRRSRVVEADIEKLTSRVAALRTACCTLAAERDGWRRQARDLRALMAARISGGAAVEAAAAIGAPGTPASTVLSAKGAPLHMTLAEALATAHGSRSSGDSLGAAVGAAAGAGAAQSGAVAAQLEDLKKEATFLRQQLSLALASVGNGSVAGALGPTDTGGSRMFGLASGGGPPTVRQQRSLLTLPRMSDSPHSAAMPVQVVGTVEGVERSGGGAGGAGDGAPTWGLSVFPNASFANAPDMFLTTETSGLSAGSGDGGLGAGKSPHSGPSPGVGVDGSATAGKSKKLHGKTTSSSQGTTTGLAAAASVAGQGPPAAALTDRGSVAKQANGIGGGADSQPLAPLPMPIAAFGSAVTPIVSGVAEVTVAATPPSPLVTKADPQPQVFGELRGSSAASNGGRRSSVEEEMSQPSSAGRGSAVPLSLRGSRAKGSGTGAAGGTGGILRLLCSKGAAPAGSPHSSPPRGLSQQQQH